MRLLHASMRKCGRVAILIKHSDSDSGLSHRSRNRGADIFTEVCFANFREYEKSEIDGDLVRQTDQKVLVSSGIETNLPDLAQYDQIKDGELLYSIKNIKSHRSPNGGSLYEFQVRR